MNEDTGGSRDRRGAGILTAHVAGIALLAVACSGGNSPAAAGSTAAGSTAYQKALAYAQCLRSHGEPGWPDPNSQGNFRITGANHVQQGSPQFASANKACEHLLPDGGQETAAQQQQALSQALKFVACMRSHGIPDFPDPTVQDGQVSMTLGASGFARNSPQLQSARQACRSLGPGDGP